MSADTILPSPEAAGEVYDLLVSIGGADGDSRESFALYTGEKYDWNCSEWRFQGHFGFGGKFRTRRDGKSPRDWYVDYYPEDDTLERAGLLKILNNKLEELRKKHTS